MQNSKKFTNSERLLLCIPIFIAVLLIIAKIWKQLKYPSTDEWIRICVCTYICTHTHICIYTRECYSVIKKNEILPFAATWMDLEGTMASKIKSDRERQIPYGITYMWNLKNTTN